MNALLPALLSRRSVGPRHLTGPDLTEGELLSLAEAAAAAPDHGMLGPLQLIHIPARHRGALAEVFAQAALEADPMADAAALQAARDRAMAGPALIAVLARLTPDHPVVPVEEQWVAVGAGLQNLLLAALSLGLDAKPLSGRRVKSQALRQAFRLPDTTHLVAFVALGRAVDDRRERPRRKPGDLMQSWSPVKEASARNIAALADKLKLDPAKALSCCGAAPAAATDCCGGSKVGTRHRKGRKLLLRRHPA
ncbi:MAG: nitroreductase family protein [Brevundimonas sp.]|uniref:nitroreductase family protein n=1 Tax=Brevundimonas sp. TaxID=1871086 RepID=UPI002736EA8E|nr:nitroreductase family protein [Brevundimonas sp.]MDP3377099.1 nitroreductase family protein [Brevundimonas sp.]